MRALVARIHVFVRNMEKIMSAFDYMLMPMRCPNCSQKHMEPIQELLKKRTTTCTFCDEPIDLKNMQPAIAEFAKTTKEITFNQVS
jgi:hypothetical protein